MGELPLPAVNLDVICPDGGTGTPTPRQQRLFEAAQSLLQADPHFGQLNHPSLSRAEVNDGLTETQPGYLYLRYDVPGAMPQEFWAHYGPQNRVTWKGGQVTVEGT